MRVWRLPALIVIPLLLVAAAVVSRGQQGTGEVPPGLAELAMPTVASAGSPGSTWFCAGGTATRAEGSQAREHVVAVGNVSDQPRRVRLVAYPSGAQPVERAFDLPARTRRDVALHELLEASHVAALVEVDGGGVAVQHEVRGPAGRSVSPCASAPAASWYFPAGTTRPGSQLTLSLFNPFPTDAVVDITFDADDGARSPENFQGLVVPAGTVMPIDVSAVVTLRQEIATHVQVRAGRLVVDQLQVADGLSLVLGGVLGAEAWVFPDGAGSEGKTESVVLYNPNDSVADVEVQPLLDNPEANGTAEPFVVSVGPRRYEMVDVLADGRVPAAVGHSIIVRSTNGVGVLAERSVAGAEGGRRGVAFTMGSPATASRWVAAVGGLEGARAASVSLVNPWADREATVRVDLVGQGGVIEAGRVTLRPGERQVVRLELGAEGSDPSRSIVVDSSEPVVAEVRFGFSNDSTFSMASPVLDTITTPSPDALYVPSSRLGEP